MRTPNSRTTASYGVFLILATFVFFTHAIKSDGREPSKEEEDTPIDVLWDVLNLIVSVYNILTFIFAGGCEEIVSRLVLVVVVTTITLVAVVLCGCASSGKRSSRAFRRSERACVSALNLYNMSSQHSSGQSQCDSHRD